MDTESWLRELELDGYIAVFQENHLDWSSLPYLTESDLIAIGIVSLGHRKKLLRAIEALKSAGAQASDNGAPGSIRSAGSERRQISIVFCDLVGSTLLSNRLDAEEMDAVIRNYQKAVTPVIQKFEGHVARFSGDGILCYFGYPYAIECEAELAVHAGLEVCRVVAEAEFHPGIQSQVRVGIATGDVVVGELYNQGTLYESMVTGETPNLAARLQSVAEPGTVTICSTTKNQAGNTFIYADNGLRELSGFEKSIQTWRVTGHNATNDRYQFSRKKENQLSLVGREQEISALQKLYQAARAGQGNSALIQGEAGVGKSRLVNSFCDSLQDDEAVVVRLHCSRYSKSSPLFPIVNFLNNATGADPEQDDATRAEKLQNLIDVWFSETSEIYPFLCRLLDIKDEAAEKVLAGMSPQSIREKTLDAGVRMLTHGSTDSLILFFIEDIHWADASTLQFLALLNSRISELRISLVMTARKEISLDWANSSLTLITVDRLEDTDILHIIEDLSADHPLPREVLQQVVEKSEGVPLFAEEITRSLMARPESDWASLLSDGELDDLSVPTALQSGLMMRLDMLGDAKEFVLMSAVIGREFSLGLAAAISGLSEQAAAEAIGKLREADIIQKVPASVPPRYSFSHALLRDVAYGNLLRSQRQQIHLAIAETLLTQFPQAAANQPERLAHHYARGMDFLQSISYWIKAGQRALAASANQEAVEHAERGLKLLPNVEDISARIGLELQLQMTLAPALTPLKGFAAPEVKAIFNRAHELCETLGASEQLFPVMRGLMAFYTVHADYASAISMGQDLEKVISPESDLGHQLELSWVLGSAYLFKGEIRKARALFERGRTLYDPAQHRIHTVIYGQDPGIATMTHYIVALNLQGSYTEAVALEQRIHESLDNLNHPFTRAQAMGFLQSTAYLRGERGRLHNLATDNLVFCQQQGFPVFMAMAMIYEGWSLALSGDGKGAAMTRDGINIYELSGAQTSKPSFLTVLAEAHMSQNNLEEALVALNEASEAAERTGELLFRPAINIARAELLLLQDDATSAQEAVNVLRNAVLETRGTGARHYELVCLTKLVRLLLASGEPDGDELKQLTTLYKDWQNEIAFAPVQEARDVLSLAKADAGSASG
jgi:class 3 adenylate cyclase/tetratricopeptide (TPR) repeat protein